MATTTLSTFGTDFQFIHYPGGEYAVRWLQPKPPYSFPKVLQTRLNNADSIIKLILVTDLLIRTYGNLPKTLRIGYMPYARQDREEFNGFSLQAIATIIDNLGYKTIEVVDCHSNVTAACFKNSRLIDQSPLTWIKTWLDRIKFKDTDIIVIPDLGASKKIQKMFPQAKTLQFTKVRNPITGELTDAKLASDGFLLDTEYTKLVIIDDICDGGRTFTNIGIELTNLKIIKPDIQLHLWVSHGIFSKGFAPLIQFDSIGCLDTFNPSDYYQAIHSPIDVIPWFE